MPWQPARIRIRAVHPCAVLAVLAVLAVPGGGSAAEARRAGLPIKSVMDVKPGARVRLTATSRRPPAKGKAAPRKLLSRQGVSGAAGGEKSRKRQAQMEADKLSMKTQSLRTMVPSPPAAWRSRPTAHLPRKSPNLLQAATPGPAADRRCCPRWPRRG
jgi:hypothetical protein